MEKNCLMNMTNFPADLWYLHRKVFHRFIKYKKYFVKATKELQEYINANLTKVKVEKTPPPQPVRDEKPVHIIDLLSSSEGEVSEDSSSDTETGDETENEGETVISVENV